MKLLYFTRGDHVDYQNDCLLIGLKELFGTDVIDVNKQSHNYLSYDTNRVSSLYGMGMSVTRILDDHNIDRTDILEKIKAQYFDYIIYGSIWRFNQHLQYVLQYYPKHKIIVVDGEDEIRIHHSQKYGVLYFKRELIKSSSNVFPIHFAIPTCKLNFTNAKTRNIAICDPRDRSTYIYKNEIDYYNGYRESRFAYTMKKAGWDCLRHYEILTNGSIPLFLDISNCPQNTCTSLPKQLLCNVLNDLNHDTYTNVFDKYISVIQQHTKEHNTTIALAKYLINTVSRVIS